MTDAAITWNKALNAGYDTIRDIYGWHATKDGHPLGKRGRPWEEGHHYKTMKKAREAAIEAFNNGWSP